MSFTDKRVVVVGAGVSGLAAAELLLDQGARVVLNDARETLDARADAARARGAAFVLGRQSDDVFDGADAVVVSPGVPFLDRAAALEARGVEVMSEVELASRFLRADVVAITGTNGKSTVVTLVGEMMRRSGRPTFVGGNLGVPLSSAVRSDANDEGGAVVAELSSFQLEHVSSLRPRVAVLLNVTPDHLDRYESFEAYAWAKGRVFAFQGAGDAAVVPAGDALCRGLLPSAEAAAVHAFGEALGEVRVVDGHIVDEATGFTFAVDALPMRGLHNQENACAAVLAARLMGADGAAIASALREVQGLAHRAQLVRELSGISYVDDSKATNVGATVAALDGLASPARRAVLIAGGVDKGGSYAPLAERLAQVGRGVVLIGEAQSLISEALSGLSLPIERASTMEQAVSLGRAMARPGDLVLLAPACSSFDMFRSYAHRGDVFADAVRALTEDES